MTEKRFTVGKELRVVDDNILKGTFYFCTDRAEALKLADKLNEFHNENVRLVKENEQLKKELFETKKDYILETYSDNPVRRDEKLKELEKELEE